MGPQTVCCLEANSRRGDGCSDGDTRVGMYSRSGDLARGRVMLLLWRWRYFRFSDVSFKYSQFSSSATAADVLVSTRLSPARRPARSVQWRHFFYFRVAGSAVWMMLSLMLVMMMMMMTLFDAWKSNKVGVGAGTGGGRRLGRRVVVDTLAARGGGSFPGGGRSVSHHNRLSRLMETVTRRHSSSGSTVRIFLVVECNGNWRKWHRSRHALMVSQPRDVRRCRRYYFRFCTGSRRCVAAVADTRTQLPVIRLWASTLRRIVGTVVDGTSGSSSAVASTSSCIATTRYRIRRRRRQHFRRDWVHLGLRRRRLVLTVLELFVVVGRIVVPDVADVKTDSRRRCGLDGDAVAWWQSELGRREPLSESRVVQFASVSSIETRRLNSGRTSSDDLTSATQRQLLSLFVHSFRLDSMACHAKMTIRKHEVYSSSNLLTYLVYSEN